LFSEFYNITISSAKEKGIDDKIMESFLNVNGVAGLLEHDKADTAEALDVLERKLLPFAYITQLT